MVGLPFSGKTTLARKLERECSALRLTPDEWHVRLFGQDAEEPEHNARHSLIEALLWNIARRALELDTNVILDFGFWAREEREDYRLRAKQLGAGSEVHFLNVSKDEVTFSYIDNKDKLSNGKGKKKTLTLSIHEFIRRFLLHILPRGYCKIRYIGVLGNRNKKTKLDLCQKLTKFIKLESLSVEGILLKITKGKIFICPICKGSNFRLAKIDSSDLYCKLE